jgi:hypothetical protein
MKKPLSKLFCFAIMLLSSGISVGQSFGTFASAVWLPDCNQSNLCADHLRKKGLEASRISFVSFGECCPVEMELIDGRDNPDGRSKNRRALINIARE